MFFESLSSIVRSLRFRLMLWNGFAVLIMGGAVLLSVREGVRNALLRELDAILQQDLEEIELAVKESSNVDWPDLQLELNRKARGHSVHGWFVQFYDAQGMASWSSIHSPMLSELPKVAKSQRNTSAGGFRLAARKLPGMHARAATVVVGSSQAFIARDIVRIDQQVMLAGAAMLLIAPLGGYLLALRATLPVAQMIAITSSLRPDKLEERLTVRGTGDELDKLAITINGLLDRINAYIQQNRDFLANAAHELRTPLAALRSTVEVTLNGQRTAAEYSDLLTDVVDQCTSLQTLVNQLLLLAETDSDRLGAGVDLIDFNVLVEKTIDMFQAVAEFHGLTLTSGPLPQSPVSGNRHHLRQLLNNLLDNSIKFTAVRYRSECDPALVGAIGSVGCDETSIREEVARGKGAIQVQLQRLEETGEVVLQIADNGLGIAAQHLPHLFERFYRADRSRTRETVAGGTGLGLSICKAIVAAHGGAIEVRSELGEGTTFIVRLPLGRRTTRSA